MEPIGATGWSQFIASSREWPDRVGGRIEPVPAYGASFP